MLCHSTHRKLSLETVHVRFIQICERMNSPMIRSTRTRWSLTPRARENWRQKKMANEDASKLQLREVLAEKRASESAANEPIPAIMRTERCCVASRSEARKSLRLIL